jgi:hypothetical protein
MSQLNPMLRTRLRANAIRKPGLVFNSFMFNMPMISSADHNGSKAKVKITVGTASRTNASREAPAEASVSIEVSRATILTWDEGVCRYLLILSGYGRHRKRTRDATSCEAGQARN